MDTERKTVLVVEDNKIVVQSIAFQLEQAGFDMVHVTNGEDAIEQYRNNRFAFILMDIGIEGNLDGAQTTHELRKLEQSKAYPRCLIVALTSHVQQKNREYYESMGIDHTFEKPLSAEKIKEILDMV